MSTLADQLYARAKIIPVKNKISTVEKLSDGALKCVRAGGEVFTIPAAEHEMQAFAVYSMLNADCTA